MSKSTRTFRVTRVSEVTISDEDLGRFRKSYKVDFSDEDWSSAESVVNAIDFDWWAGGNNSEYVTPVSTVVEVVPEELPSRPMAIKKPKRPAQR